jgi:tRNA1(Val) A37 N6-methylase TrmN6
VIDRFLPQAAALLSEQGAFYMVVVQENRPNEIIAILESLGLTGQVELLCFCSSPSQILYKVALQPHRSSNIAHHVAEAC